MHNNEDVKDFIEESKLERARLLAFRTWGIIGCAVLFFLAIYVLGKMSDAVDLLAIGMLIGFMCSPMTNYLQSKGLNRSLAALIALLVLLLIVTRQM